MPPYTRRALLATAAAGATAGCSSVLNSSPSATPPTVTGIEGRSVFVADGVTVPSTDGVATVADPAEADVAVFPPGDDSVAAVARVLRNDTPVAVAGTDAQWTVMQACDETERSYGFASDGWGPDTRVAAAVPRESHLDTHAFVGAELPRDLPWALGELFDPLRGDCAIPVESPSVPDAAVPVGASRIRGLNDVGGFDRWDRVRTASDDSGTSFFVDTEATIDAGSRDGGAGAYRSDQVRLAADFDGFVADVGPGTAEGDGLTATHTVVSDDSAGTSVDHTFSPPDDTRESFTACTRAKVTVEAFEAPFSYVANARFRWRDPQLLEDDTWGHHTPGNAVWYP